MAKGTGKVGRGGSRGPAQVGACLLPSSFFHTGFRGLSPAWVWDAFFRTEGPGHSFGFEMASNWFFDTGKSSNVLAALLTGDALLEGVQVENSLGLCALRLCLICSWCPGA